MAWYKCGGGGALSETVLWNNPNPTSTFNSQDVTLSDNFENYEFIKIYAKPYKSSNNVYEFYFKVDTLLQSTTGSNKPACALGGRDSSGNQYLRAFLIGADHTLIGFVSAGRVNASNSMNNDNVIPIKISGLK